MAAFRTIYFPFLASAAQEGWAVVLVPGDFNRVVARIAPADWAALATVPER